MTDVINIFNKKAADHGAYTYYADNAKVYREDGQHNVDVYDRSTKRWGSYDQFDQGADDVVECASFEQALRHLKANQPSTLEGTIAKNKEAQEHMKLARAKNNKNVLRSYRIK